MKLTFYVKEECPACRNAKEKVSFFLEKWGMTGSVETEHINLDTADGLVEAALNSVADVPTIVLHRDGGEVARWAKKAPTSDELKTELGI